MKLDPFYLIVDSAEWIARLVPLGHMVPAEVAVWTAAIPDRHPGE